MVSLQESNSSGGSSKTIQLNIDNLQNKRKTNHDGSLDNSFGKRFRSTETTDPVFEIELQLETPLPLEWQRCLDIQSGKIHFYNTRTQKRTIIDPTGTSTQEPVVENNVSLELELNLSCNSQRSKNNHKLMENRAIASVNNEKKNKLLKVQEEMVAIVCERCHLLVMLCKSSPSCPNCKFMHSNHFNQQTLLPSCTAYL